MMKIGLETESYHIFFQNRLMNIFDFIERTYQLGCEGVEINIISDLNLHPEFGTLESADPNYLKAIRRAIEDRNLYCEIDTRFTSLKEIKKAIYIANYLGADVIRTYMFRLGSYNQEKLPEIIADLKQAIPLLKQNRIKLAIENHEEETADELISVIEAVNSQWIGAHLDIGNGMMAWEDPITTCKKLAPYTISTHFKDHMVTMHNDIPVVCGMPLTEGSIDLEECFKIIVEYSTVTRVNLEVCFPYCSAFKRPEGTGGWTRGFSGAFAIKEPPFDQAKVLPLDYYYPSKISKELLDEMLVRQDEGVKKSIIEMHRLRDKFAKPLDVIEQNVL